MEAFEEARSATQAASWVPWQVIPADHKWVARAVVAYLDVLRSARLDLDRIRK